MKSLILKIILITVLIGCSSFKDSESDSNENKQMEYQGHIYLYGESHGNEKILNKEFELWNSYYKSGMRHLFVELPYYTTEFLNIWLKEDSDQILNQLYSDSAGTPGNTPYSMEFYIKIKEQCPETIFHGTDVGHQYESTGIRFLDYLEKNNLQDSLKYKLTEEVIDQGIYFYGPPKDYLYRENKMVSNFIRELETLDNTDLMGIYGSAHTKSNDLNFTEKIPNMFTQICSIVNCKITTTDLTPLAKDIESVRTDDVSIHNKTYKASYYGRQDLTGFKNFKYREFWCIENAYEDFKSMKKGDDVLPYDNYLMNIELKNIYMVKYKYLNGESETLYYISEGRTWKDKPVTENIIITD